MSTAISWADKPALKQVTLRATLVGLFIGSLVLISNFQFGLQTGWVSMMSLPSALLACGIFRHIWPLLFTDYPPFSDVENVYVQSIAVAVGTGPLAYGFVGVLPAIEKFMTREESGGLRDPGDPFTLRQLLLWSLGLAFFGIFLAVPLRKQVIIREKLPFPSGSSTALLISVLNGSEILQEVTPQELVQMRRYRLARQEDERPLVASAASTVSPEGSVLTGNYLERQEEASQRGGQYASNVSTLLRTFAASSAYTLLSYFVPYIKAIPLFGRHLSETYLWNVQFSPAYIGQGMIMGFHTVFFIMMGCVLGWGILAPLARHMGWVPPDADINDWEKGVQGWILWSSLAVMVADSVVGFIVLTVKATVKFVLIDNKADALNSFLDDSIESMLLEEQRELDVKGESIPVKLVNADQDHEVDSKYLVRCTTVISGWIVSSLICVISMLYLFGKDCIPIYSLLLALLIAIFLSILGVRALGETDLNPVSGIGKLAQIIFAIVVPRDHKAAVLINLVAGSIAEAGAQQAGDLMQDLKTGHLIGASPRAQFTAQIIGASWSIGLSSIMYIFYNKVYEIPSQQFRIPTAFVWIDCARLVMGMALPRHALTCSIILGSIFAVISLVKNCLDKDKYRWAQWLPSGVALGVGMYNSPSFSIARFIGGMISYYWLRTRRGDSSAKTNMIIFSSGMILGEGVCSIVSMTLASLGTPHM
ncbi:AaceriAFL016Cp [[Ashbya] aceris (nom. inval.)]|nr:AaceriAFL016Cp [[Ashbya] aceris (nom. inval.)]